VRAFSPDRTAFGRHETFPLRFGWLTKGFAAWQSNPAVFDSDDATVDLGVGKNMVTAIRYWLSAAQVLAHSNRALTATTLGEQIFGSEGWDPYLEDDATIWLIHWLIASNAAEATTPFWFFNRFHKPEFTAKELQDALNDFIERDVTATRASPSTIKHDIALLLRMYQTTSESKLIPTEEALDSPLSMLELLRHSEGSRYHESRPENRPSLPLAPFAYAVAELFEHLGQSILPVEQLLRSDGIVASPGSVFRLTEEGLLGKLEQLTAWLPMHFELRETAGIHQLYQLRVIGPLQMLRLHYHRANKGKKPTKRAP
jgi:hypothetical protein